MTSVREHYDKLIAEGNDPVLDPKPLQDYMDKWDGAPFLDALALDGTKTVLEIGVGTGRLALKTAPLCRFFCGIDLSPKTAAAAKEHLALHPNAELLCTDFLNHPFEMTFDVIYSSLTLLHIRDKQSFLEKVHSLLNPNGRFVLSIDKNQTPCLTVGDQTIETYPDTPEDIRGRMERIGFAVTNVIERDFAFVLVGQKA